MKIKYLIITGLMLWSQVLIAQQRPPGMGTASSPFIITELSHLVWLSEGSGGLEEITAEQRFSANYKLGQDIDAADSQHMHNGKGFKPIGGSNGFRGEFDGNGYCIKNLYINRPEEDKVGFFGYLGYQYNYLKLSAHNIILENAQVTGRNEVGVLAGFSRVSTSDIVIKNSEVNGQQACGLLIGQTSYSTMERVGLQGAVNGKIGVGGMLGAASDGFRANDIYTEVDAVGQQNVGGVFGKSVRVTGFKGILNNSSVQGDDSVYVAGNVGQISQGAVKEAYFVQSKFSNSGIMMMEGELGLSDAELKQDTLWQKFDADYWSLGGYGAYDGLVLSTFQYDRQVNVASNISGYGPEGSGDYTFGDQVRISAVKQYENQYFLHWEQNGQVLSRQLEYSFNLAPTSPLRPKAIYEILKPLNKGAGTAESPYLIETLADLREWSEEVPALSNVHVALAADLDAAETKNWNDGQGFKPINFAGFFHGRGHTISNLYINRPGSNVGFFNKLDVSVLQDFHLKDVDFTGEKVGGIAVDLNYITSVRHVSVSGKMAGKIGGGLFTYMKWPGKNAEISNIHVNVNFTKNTYGSAFGGLAYNYRDPSFFYVPDGQQRKINKFHLEGQISADQIGGLFADTNNSIYQDNDFHYDQIFLNATFDYKSSPDFKDPFIATQWVIETSSKAAYWSQDKTGLDTANFVGVRNNALSDLEIQDKDNFEGFDFDHTWSLISEAPELMQNVRELFVVEQHFEGVHLSVSEYFIPAGERLWLHAPLVDGFSFSHWESVGDLQQISQQDSLEVVVAGNDLAFKAVYHALDDTPPFEGEGTESAPYLIKEAADLIWLSQHADYWEALFLQAQNITFSAEECEKMQPVGRLETPFSGIYDGGHHQIKSLQLWRSSSNYLGLFGYASNAEIRNLHLESFSVLGEDHVGALLGGGYFRVYVENCHGNDIEVEGSHSVGALVGSLNSGEISSSAATNLMVKGRAAVGGLVGYGSYLGVDKVFAIGEVRGKEVVGGLIGAVDFGFPVISQSYALSSVVGDRQAQALFGYLDTEASLTSVYYAPQYQDQSVVEGVVALDESDFALESSFIDWDFESDWLIAQNPGVYATAVPQLQSSQFVTITVTTSEGGSVSSSPERLKIGEDLTLDVSAEEGYVFDRFLVNGNPLFTEDQIVITDVQQDLNIYLSFKKYLAGSEAQTLAAYPNPTYGTVYLPNAEAQRVEVRSSSGKLIAIQQVKAGAIHLAGWPAGIYFLQTTDGRNAKIVKY
ncbi:T9SS type A sorting domain-containing protein [Persicobacter diffluens]|uniref:Bacterial repeat domain-containing protein n=1 Tax=Persicobacter diffluens TaxID=981 RepID=A0AAN4VWX0_9BACT|nr:hypothetical protein PEDI_09600 [Persicobacter diffluens]